jgi:hypothetical protein
VSPGQDTERSYSASAPASWEGVPSRIREVVELRQAALGPVGSAAQAEGVLIAFGAQMAPVTSARPPFDAQHTVSIAEIRMPLGTGRSETTP